VSDHNLIFIVTLIVSTLLIFCYDDAEHLKDSIFLPIHQGGSALAISR
jgi:hypothetical protein